MSTDYNKVPEDLPAPPPEPELEKSRNSCIELPAAVLVGIMGSVSVSKLPIVICGCFNRRKKKIMIPITQPTVTGTMMTIAYKTVVGRPDDCDGVVLSLSVETVTQTGKDYQQ